MVFRGSKKGENELVMYTLFVMVLILGVILLTFMLFSYNLFKSNFFERAYAERDIAMTIDLMHASPNDMMLKYGDDYLKGRDNVYFTVYIKNNRVEAYDKDQGNGYINQDKNPDIIMGSVFPFTKTNNVEVKSARITPEILEKKGDKIIYKIPYEIGFQRNAELNKININVVDGSLITLPTQKEVCPTLSTVDKDWQKSKQTVIDPAGDIGRNKMISILNKGTINEINTWVILEPLCQSIIGESGFYDTKNSCQTQEVSFTDRLDIQPDLLVSIDFYQAESNDEYRIFYNTNLESEKFACILKSKIERNFPNKEVTMQVLDVSKDTIFKTAGTGQIGVIFYLGDIDKAELSDYVIIDIKNTITEAVRSYYG